MRHLIIAACVAAGFSTVAAASDTYVHGYYKQDGTYVAPHHRTTPDNQLQNNYSSQGQINPYTGAQGTRHNELSSPPAYQHSSPYYTPTQPATPRTNQNLYSPQPSTTYGTPQPQRSSNPYGW